MSIMPNFWLLEHYAKHELAKDIQNTHPGVSQILLNNMDVGNVLAGGHNIEEANEGQTQLITALNSAGLIEGEHFI